MKERKKEIIKNGKQKSEEWKEKKRRKGKNKRKEGWKRREDRKNKGSTTYKIHQ